MTSSTPSPIEIQELHKLEKKFGLDLKNIREAQRRSVELRTKLASRLEKAAPENCGVVVCGSLARDEMTATSDVDWHLLVDGAVSPQHRDEAQRIHRELTELSDELKF